MAKMSISLERFFNQCRQTNLEESDKEEKERYRAVAYANRIINFLTNVQNIRERQKNGD